MSLTRIVAVVWVIVASAGVAAQSPEDALGFGESAPAPSPGSAQDALGFGESPAAAVTAPAAHGGEAAGAGTSEPGAAWSYRGWLRLQTAFAPERPQPSRIAKLRTVIGGEARFETAPATVRLRAVAGGRAEYDLAYELHRSAWDAATLDTYELKLIPNDAFLALELGPLELRAGKQIVNLGQGEVLGVLDSVNPRDQREPAAADLEELRLSVLLTRATLSLGPHRLEAVVVHEPYFGLNPPPLGELSPLRALLLEPAGTAVLATRDLRYRHEPGRDPTQWRAIQPYGRLALVAPGLDVSFIAASLLEPLGIPTLPEPAEFSQPQIDLPVHHPRFTRFGHSGALAVGAFVLRWEAAFDLQRPLALRELNTPFVVLAGARRHQLQGLLGLTYAPSATTSAGLEVQRAYVFENPARDPVLRYEPLWPLEALQLALRFDHRFLRDRAQLQVVLLWIGVDPFNAFVARAELGYAVSDGLSLGVGAVVYEPSAHEFGPFFGLGESDRVFANLRWDFALE